MAGTAWRDANTARAFVEDRRCLLPYGSDQIRLMLQLVEHFCPNPKRVLDLGCGDGIMGRTVLNTYPGAYAVLLDHSEPMLEMARKQLVDYGDRCEIQWADLAQPLVGNDWGGPFDLVVSGFAIHHLPDGRKRSLYGEISELLGPGGLFVNVEHVASPSRRLEELFENLYISYMSEGSGRPLETVTAHYHSRPDKADNILLHVETQLQWLRELGYTHVDCYFKWLELAVFGGVRGI